MTDSQNTAPSITLEAIEANIASEHYFTAEQGVLGEIGAPWRAEIATGALPETLSLLTFCVLVLQNGFTIVGTSACVSPENFEAEIGRKVARQNAVQQMWSLMGYELKNKLSTKET